MWELLFWLVIIAATTLALMLLLMWKEYVEHIHWDLRRAATRKDYEEQFDRQAAKALEVNEKAARYMREGRRLPGDEWKTNDEGED
jgi:hypothetical protein